MYWTLNALLLFLFHFRVTINKTTLCNGLAHSSVSCRGICCVAPSSHSLTLSYYRVIHKPPRNLQATGHFAYFKSAFSVCIGKYVYCSLPPPLPSFSPSLPASKADLVNVLSEKKKKAFTRSHCFTNWHLCSLLILPEQLYSYVRTYLPIARNCVSTWLM